MSLFHASDRISPALDRQAAVVRFLPFLYGLTLFVSALLLFSIQPMFAKMVCRNSAVAGPVVGRHGVFSDGVAGRLCSPICYRALRPSRAAMFHLLLIGVTAMMLPIAITPDG